MPDKTIQSSYIAPSASITGMVSMGDLTSVWHSATIRGDIAEIRVGARSNIQDGAILHVAHASPCTIGEDVTIGHGAIVHGCTIGNRCLIGMGSILLNNAIIGDDSVVGAGALVTEGKVFPPRSLIVGIPARAIRSLTEDELKKIIHSAASYCDLAHKTAHPEVSNPNPIGNIELPSEIPHIEGIEALYPPDTIDIQRDRYKTLIQQFFNTYPEHRGAKELLCISSPGRTEICGNHTDHNRGTVLCAAINLDTIAIGVPREDSRVRIVSEGFGRLDLDLTEWEKKNTERGTSAALIRGIWAGLLAIRMPQGRVLHGFDACIQSNIPPGSGLSSSASFEILIGALVAQSSGLKISPIELASIGQYAENEYFGKPCGLMDQMACAVGSFSRIDFSNQEKPSIECIDFDPEAYGLSLVVVSTGGTHANLFEEYASIPAEMKRVAAEFGKDALSDITAGELLCTIGTIRKNCGDRAFLRAWHFVHENKRIDALVQAIKEKDIRSYCTIVRESGDSSVHFLQNIFASSNPAEQGILVGIALTEEFLVNAGACRVHGGGFAGTIQAYIPSDKKVEYCQYMEGIFGKNSVFPLRTRPFGVVCIEGVQRSVT
jgi:galactokinase